jgi:hypothetical protein
MFLATVLDCPGFSTVKFCSMPPTEASTFCPDGFLAQMQNARNREGYSPMFCTVTANERAEFVDVDMEFLTIHGNLQ